MATVEADVLGPRLDAARAGLGDGGVTVSTSRDVARMNSGEDAAGTSLATSGTGGLGGFLQRPIGAYGFAVLWYWLGDFVGRGRLRDDVRFGRRARCIPAWQIPIRSKHSSCSRKMVWMSLSTL